MHAYLVIDVNIVDLNGFMEYAGRIPDLIARHGGRYVVQGVEPEVIEARGDDPQRSVVIEFPDRGAAEAFLTERAGTDLHEIWARTTRSRILLVDGCT